MSSKHKEFVDRLKEDFTGTNTSKISQLRDPLQELTLMSV